MSYDTVEFALERENNELKGTLNSIAVQLADIAIEDFSHAERNIFRSLSAAGYMRNLDGVAIQT